MADQWARVLRHLLQEKPNLGSYLEKGVVQELVHGQGQDTLVIGYDDGSAFFMDLVQKEENRRVIVSAIQEVFQRPVQFKIVKVERPPRDPRQAKLKRDEQEQHRKRIKQETLAHPLVKEALNILGGEVIDIKDS